MDPAWFGPDWVWTFASELVFQDLIPGDRDNQLEMDYFGVPFFPQNYPDRTILPRGGGKSRVMSPIGLVAKGDGPRESRHYASMDIDGEDFVILSRSGDEDAKQGTRRQPHCLSSRQDFS